MRIFNISDIPSPKLTQFNMDNQTVCLGSHMISPGNSADVGDEDPNGAVRSLSEMGVISVGDPPPEYRVKKDKLASERAAAEPPAPPPVSPDAPAEKPTKKGK